MTSQVVPACCSEKSCSRIQPLEPLRVTKPGWPPSWYIVTQHRDIGPDGFEPMQKHEAHGLLAELLERGHQAKEAKAKEPEAKNTGGNTKWTPAAPRKPSDNPQLGIEHLSGKHLSPVTGCSRCAEAQR